MSTAERDLTVRIGIIVGSTRPGRKAEDVARWVNELAAARNDAAFEVVDIARYALPHLDEPVPAAAGGYTQSHTRQWAERIASFNGFVFVTPEYNHSIPGVLKNAIDFLFAEWSDKAAGFVGYGARGGSGAIEHLRLVMGVLKVANISAQVELTLHDDFEGFSELRPRPQQGEKVGEMLDELVARTQAQLTVR